MVELTIMERVLGFYPISLICVLNTEKGYYNMRKGEQEMRTILSILAVTALMFFLIREQDKDNRGELLIIY